MRARLAGKAHKKEKPLFVSFICLIQKKNIEAKTKKNQFLSFFIAQSGRGGGGGDFPHPRKGEEKGENKEKKGKKKTGRLLKNLPASRKKTMEGMRRY